MSTNSPYVSPSSNVLDEKIDEVGKVIESLDISEKWKAKFRAIAAAGGPKMPHIKALPKDVRRRAFSFNLLAFLFGPFYYFSKGMWKRGTLLFFAMFAIVFVVATVLVISGYGQYSKALGYGVAAFFAVRANADYYKKMVLKDNGWI